MFLTNNSKLLKIFLIFKFWKNWFSNNWINFLTTSVCEIVSSTSFRFLSTFLKKKKIFYKKKKFFKNQKVQKPIPNSKEFTLYKTTFPKNIFVRLQILPLRRLLFIPSKIKTSKYFFEKFNSNELLISILNTFLQKNVVVSKLNWWIFWKNLLITIADIKMRAMLEYYDYFGLYSTARNYICVHSELNLNKSLVRYAQLKPSGFYLNNFFKIFLRKNSKRKNPLQKVFKWFSFVKKIQLQNKLFNDFYQPFCVGKFEKTDPLHRAFFLDKYLIYWKLMPYATKDFLGYISEITKTEKFLYAYPYHVSSVFFKNFFNIFTKKWKWFLTLKQYHSKYFFKILLFSYINMTMWKLPSNKFSKRTDAHFDYPYSFLSLFIKKSFETKNNWLNDFFKSNALSSKSSGEILKLLFSNKFWLAYALNWSSGKRFFRKAWEFVNYSNLDYFKKAKYVRRDLVVDSFSSWVWKDFSAYAEKFTYNSLNFNSRKLLRVLFPHQKLIEYSLLKSNNLYSAVQMKEMNRKFFSLLKIFWKGWEWKKKPLSSYKLFYPIDFDFVWYESQEKFISFLHDIDVTQIFYTHPFPEPLIYYKEIFCSKKKTQGFEFNFSKNLVLASTLLTFPIVLNSRFFAEWFYLLVIKKSEFKDLDKIKDSVNNINHLYNSNSITAYRKYISHIRIFQSRLLFLINNIFIAYFGFKNRLFGKILINSLFFKNKELTSLTPLSKIFALMFLFNFFKFIKFWISSFREITLFKWIILKTFTFINNTATFFTHTNFALKPYFTQTIRSAKKQPITYFWMVGSKKTSSTGTITISAFNLNIFPPATFFTLTMNWKNPIFYSFDVWKLNSYSIPKITYIENVKFSDLEIWLSWIFFDNVLNNILNVNASVLNFNFLKKIKIDLFNLVPFNILKFKMFFFWYDFILNFENKSLNFLTSKMWRKTKRFAYFFGSINILLHTTNKILASSLSKNKSLYFTSIYSLALLEVRALDFPDLVFPFKFDPKKLNLGWKHRLLKIFYKENFFFFLRENFFPQYFNKVNIVEFHLLLNFTTSIFLNLSRFKFLKNFLGPVFELEKKESLLFPGIFFNSETTKNFSFWWLFFGLTKTSFLSTTLLKSISSLLVILFHYAWHMVLNFSANPLYFEDSLSDLFFSTPTNLYQNNFSFYLPTLRFQLPSEIMLWKFLFLKFFINDSITISWAIINFNFFKLSNFYTSMLKGSNFWTFNATISSILPQKKSFIFQHLSYIFNNTSKKFYLKNIIQKWKFINFHFCIENFFTIHFLQFFKFKSAKIKLTYSNFSIFIWALKFYSSIFFSKFFLLFRYWLKVFWIFFQKILIIFRLLICISKFSRKNLFFLIYSFILFFFLKKTYLNKFYFQKLNNFSNFFHINLLLQIKLNFVNLRSMISTKEYLPAWRLFFMKLGKFTKKKYSLYLNVKRQVSFYFSFFFLSNFFINFYSVSLINFLKTKMSPKFSNIYIIFTNLYIPVKFFGKILKIFPNLFGEKVLQNRINFFNPTTNNIVNIFEKSLDSKTLFYSSNKALINLVTNIYRIELKDNFFFWFKFLTIWFHNFLLFKDNWTKNNFLTNYPNNFLKIRSLLNFKIKNPILNKNLFLIKHFYQKKTKVYIFWWLIKLFAKGKTSQIKNERILIMNKPKKLRKAFHAIINKKLMITYWINKKTISFFYKKKIKLLIKWFLAYILRKKKLLNYSDHFKNDLCYFNLFKFVFFWSKKNKNLLISNNILEKNNIFFFFFKIYFFHNFVIKLGKNLSLAKLFVQQQFLNKQFKSDSLLFYCKFTGKNFKKSNLALQLLVILPKLIVCSSLCSPSFNQITLSFHYLIPFWMTILMKALGIEKNKKILNKASSVKLLLLWIMSYFSSFFKKKWWEINLLFKNSIFKMAHTIHVYKNYKTHNIFSDVYNVVNYKAHYCDFKYNTVVVVPRPVYLMNKYFLKNISDTWILPVFFKNDWLLTFSVENFFFKIFQNFSLDIKFLVIIFFYINVKFY